MTETIAARINALRRLTVGELREKYREVFGEETRSGNRDWLWKRVAWRIQELEYGGLSERVKRRAGELANELDIRSRVPRGAFEDAPGGKRNTVRMRASELASHDRRLPMPGTVINREYKENIYQVKVLEDGFEYEGRVIKSLSAIAKEITGSHWNGFKFFNL